jgi:broad specificity phosphatase PhoE
MSEDYPKKFFLIRHFEREDLKNETKFNSEISTIVDINLRKIYAINPALYDDLNKFNDLVRMYKLGDYEKYCDDHESICEEFVKYENLVIKHIEKITSIREVPRLITIGSKRGQTKIDTINETRIIKTYFNSDECEIWSSPFLRCLQTAIFIAKLLGVTNINVHFGLSEICDPEVLGSYWSDLRTGSNVDINKIFSNSRERLIEPLLIEELVDNVYTEINDTDNTNYDKRINNTIKYIYDRNKSSVKSNIFIVSHSDSIKQYDIIPGGKGMDYFNKYEITNKIVPMFGGNSNILQKYELYMKKINKYNNKINDLKSKYL